MAERQLQLAKLERRQATAAAMRTASREDFSDGNESCEDVDHTESSKESDCARPGKESDENRSRPRADPRDYLPGTQVSEPPDPNDGSLSFVVDALGIQVSQ